jgi:hypothetical protein
LILMLDAQGRRDDLPPEQTRARLLEAKEHYDIAMEHGDYRISYLGRADVLVELGMYQEAEADIRKLMTVTTGRWATPVGVPT